MNQPTNQQLSSKVNSQTLDVIYNNFVKITDWILKGDKSQYPIPEGAFLNTMVASANNAQELASAVRDAVSLVSSLQSRLNAAEQKNTILENKIDALSTKLARLEEAAVDKQEGAAIVQEQPLVTVPIEETEVVSVQVTTPEATALSATDMTLVDLGSPVELNVGQPAEAPAQEVVVASTQQAEAPVVQPEQPVVQSDTVQMQADPVMVSAKAVDAGDLDPNAHKALHAETVNLLAKLKS